MWLFILFVAVPIIEIGLFIQVGGFIGLWPTLGIVILTAIIGSTLVRMQGISTLIQLQNSLEQGGNPVGHIAQGAMILLAGVLLLTPGFFTDATGLTLLIPPVRAQLVKWGAAHMLKAGSVSMTGQPPKQSPNTRDVVDGEYTVVEEEEPQKPGDSGWTKH